MDLSTLIAKQNRVLLDSKTVLDLAEKESRALTPEERKQHDDWMIELEKLGNAITGAKSDQAMTDQIARLEQGDMVLARVASARKSLGAQVVEQLGPWLTETKDKRVGYWQSPAIELKATLLEGTLPRPTRSPVIVPAPTRPLVMGDAFAVGQTTSNAISFLRETAFTNAADTVAEGAVKSESGLTFEPATESVRKMAHWLPVSEEALDDVPQLKSYIDARLRLGVELALDDQLLNGSTTPPDLVGILNRSGLAAPIVRTDPETNLDAVLRQISAAQIDTGLRPMVS
jgi:HK97 family phage major capsid protein